MPRDGDAADGRAHERRGAGADDRDRHRPLLVSRSRKALWKKGETSGNLQHGRRDAHRLRPGCGLAEGESRRPRRNLPHRPALLLLPDGRRSTTARPRLAGDGSTPLFDADDHLSKGRLNQLVSCFQAHSPFRYGQAIGSSCERHRTKSGIRFWSDPMLKQKMDHDARLGVIGWKDRRSGSQRPRHSSAGPSDLKPANKTGISLALGGGCARGWAHIGVLRALDEDGIEVSMIAGTSIGALVGGCYLAGKLDELEEFARSLTMRRIVGLLDFTIARQRPVRRHAADARACRSIWHGCASRTCRPFVAWPPKSAPATRSGCRAAR